MEGLMGEGAVKGLTVVRHWQEHSAGQSPRLSDSDGGLQQQSEAGTRQSGGACEPCDSMEGDRRDSGSNKGKWGWGHIRRDWEDAIDWGGGGLESGQWMKAWSEEGGRALGL